MVIFYKKWKKYNEIQLTKSKMDYLKHDKSSTLHRFQLPKNKMNLHNEKFKKSSTLPR